MCICFVCVDVYVCGCGYVRACVYVEGGIVRGCWCGCGCLHFPSLFNMLLMYLFLSHS